MVAIMLMVPAQPVDAYWVSLLLSKSLAISVVLCLLHYCTQLHFIILSSGLHPTCPTHPSLTRGYMQANHWTHPDRSYPYTHGPACLLCLHASP